MGTLDNDTRTRLGARIRARRGTLGMTQLEAADRAGVSIQTWRVIERGEHGEPRDATLAAIGTALGWTFATVDDLVAGRVEAVTASGAPFHVDNDLERDAVVALARARGDAIATVVEAAEAAGARVVSDEDDPTIAVACPDDVRRVLVVVHVRPRGRDELEQLAGRVALAATREGRTVVVSTVGQLDELAGHLAALDVEAVVTPGTLGDVWT